MASPKLTLPVILSPTAVDELHDIWLWNAQNYDPPHADAYLGYLRRHIFNLGRLYTHGKRLSIRLDLRYVLVRRKNKGHGHVVVYSFDDNAVNIIHVFHSAQNWLAEVAKERPSQ